MKKALLFPLLLSPLVADETVTRKRALELRQRALPLLLPPARHPQRRQDYRRFLVSRCGEKPLGLTPKRHPLCSTLGHAPVGWPLARLLLSSAWRLRNRPRAIPPLLPQCMQHQQHLRRLHLLQLLHLQLLRVLQLYLLRLRRRQVPLPCVRLRRGRLLLVAAAAAVAVVTVAVTVAAVTVAAVEAVAVAVVVAAALETRRRTTKTARGKTPLRGKQSPLSLGMIKLCRGHHRRVLPRRLEGRLRAVLCLSWGWLWEVAKIRMTDSGRPT